MVVVLANAEDSISLMIEAEKQGLMNGEYVFLLVQQFEVSGKVVSNWLLTECIICASSVRNDRKFLRFEILHFFVSAEWDDTFVTLAM